MEYFAPPAAFALRRSKHEKRREHITQLQKAINEIEKEEDEEQQNQQQQEGDDDDDDEIDNTHISDALRRKREEERRRKELAKEEKKLQVKERQRLRAELRLQQQAFEMDRLNDEREEAHWREEVRDKGLGEESVSEGEMNSIVESTKTQLLVMMKAFFVGLSSVKVSATTTTTTKSSASSSSSSTK